MSNKPLFSKPVKRQTLAEQMATTIREMILSNDLKAGTALPTEPKLAEQFGVSRAVVRDATRILMAQGLVEVQHGRGVFVTPSQTEAFGEALLLALRRAGATVWDVEQFEQLVFPQVVALAAVTTTDQEIAAIERLIQDYLQVFRAHQVEWQNQKPPAYEQENLQTAYHTIIQAVFDATHNQVLQQLATPLLKLRNLRSWVSGDGDTEETIDIDAIVRMEGYYLSQVVNAIATRDADQARTTIASMMQLPPQAIKVMRQTPVGQIPVIPSSPL